MNRIAFYSDSAPTTKDGVNGIEGSGGLDDREESAHDESLPYLTGGPINGTQLSRLIDASCKAFLLRRGLDAELAETGLKNT